MPIKNEIRKENYHRLIKAGFTSREANKYKDYASYSINKLVDLNEKLVEHRNKKLLESLGKSHD